MMTTKGTDTLKLNPWDIAFSRAIRESYYWTCASCGVVDVEAQSTGKSRGMQCAHVFSRKHMGIRCHPDNAVCLCASCHATYTDAPTEWGLWVLKHLGEGRYQILLDRKNDIRIKYSKQDKIDMAKHYREEYTSMVQTRMNQGNQEYIQLVAYD